MTNQTDKSIAETLLEKTVIFKRDLINLHTIQTIGLIPLQHVLQVVGHEIDSMNRVVLKLKLEGFFALFDAYVDEVETIDPKDFCEQTHISPYQPIFQQAEMIA